MAGETSGGEVQAPEHRGHVQAGQPRDRGDEKNHPVLPPSLHLDVQHQPQWRDLRGDGVEVMEERELASWGLQRIQQPGLQGVWLLYDQGVNIWKGILRRRLKTRL